MSFATFFILMAVLAAAQVVATILVDRDPTLPKRLPEA
jgi:hypothetical protein